MSGLAGFVIEGVDLAHQALRGWMAQSASAEALPGGPGLGSTIGFILLMLGVFYFVMWRPQSKQYKAHKQMLSELKKGDEVLLQNAIFAKVHEVGDKFVVLEVARDVRIRVVAGAITARLPAGTSEGGSEGQGNK